MYRYYSTEYPIRPDTFPLFANTVVSFKEKTDIPGVGSVWGYLEYEQQLSAGVAETCGLTQAKTRTFTVKVTSVHTLEVEAENEKVAIEQACGMAWEHDADEICGEVIADGNNGWAVAFELGLADNLNEVMKQDEEFRYRLLSRMQSDCNYFLGHGNRCKKYLWGQDVDAHIAYMKALWLSFPAGKKPEWLSYEEIEVYAKRMSEEAEL